MGAIRRRNLDAPRERASNNGENNKEEKRRKNGMQLMEMIMFMPAGSRKV